MVKANDFSVLPDHGRGEHGDGNHGDGITAVAIMARGIAGPG